MISLGRKQIHVSKPKSKWVSNISATPDKDKPREGLPLKDARAPFEVMYAKGQLDKNPNLNSILYSAGTRYFQDWYLSGMNPISAMNYQGSGGGSGNNAGFTPITESQMIRRESLRRARKAMRDRHIKIVEDIVLEGRSVADCREHTGYTARQYSSTAAMERLWEGLYRLAEHYGIVTYG